MLNICVMYMCVLDWDIAIGNLTKMLVIINLHIFTEPCVVVIRHFNASGSNGQTHSGFIP
jgi:hypothetical protein